MDPASGQNSSRNSLTLSMATVAASGISKETLKPFMFSDQDEIPVPERGKTRNASKSVMVRRSSNNSTTIQRKTRPTSMNEGHLRGVNSGNSEAPEYVKPKRPQAQPGLRAMLYGLDTRL
ncbi:hypothetical protein FO519_008270, partial [Halicephalobus sp. NKZ332]